MYVGVKVVASAITPEPSCVQRIEPFAAFAPLTVALASEQMISLPPAVATGNGSTSIV